MEKIRQIANNSFYQLTAIYALLIAIAFFGVISRFTLHFEIFALVVALFGYFVIEKNEKSINKKLHSILLVVSLFLIFIFRAIPYINNKIPLGYDAQIYQYALEVPLNSIPNWMITGPTMEPLFLYLMKPLTFLLSTNFILTWLFIVFNLILGLSIYYFTKEYFGERSAIISLLIFAVSTVQFITFTYMYYRNVLGIILMLTSLVFLKKSNLVGYRILFILTGGFLGAIHRPTFYIFGLSFFFYSILSPIINKKYNFSKLKFNVINGIAIIGISLLFYLGKFLPAIMIVGDVAKSYVQPGQSPGTFISFLQYQFLTLPYLAFAILGLVYLIKNKNYNILFFWTALNSMIVYFQFFFFNRFIIHLDIALIILAGVGFSLIIQSKKKFGIIVLILMIASSGFLTYQNSISAKPLIDEYDISLVEILAQQTPSNSYIMSFSSEYSPLVLAHSNRTVIAPGLFDENKWDLGEWNTLWYSQDKEKTIELMNEYDTTRPIYIYTGTKSFNNECFTLFLEQNGRKAYEYICN